MKTASAELISLLASHSFAVADCVAITLASGSVMNLTNGDGSITVGATVYKAEAMERGDISISTGIEVDECVITLYATATNTINGLALPSFALAGGFDNAKVVIALAIMPTYGDTSAGVIPVFSGNITDMTIDGFKTALTISSESIKLDTKIPLQVYQPTCVHSLYDAGCGLSRATHYEAHSAETGTTTAVIKLSSSAVTGMFSLGKVTFTTGLNAGLSRTVQKHTLASPLSTLTMAQPFPFAIAVGDSFTVYHGCDKLRATCTGKFANADHFLGWEYIPVPEESI